MTFLNCMVEKKTLLTKRSYLICTTVLGYYRFKKCFVNGSAFITRLKVTLCYLVHAGNNEQFVDQARTVCVPNFARFLHLLLFSGKKTTRKVHTRLHPVLGWRIFHILTSEDINDVISRFYTVVCAKILVYIIKRKLHGGLKI